MTQNEPTVHPATVAIIHGWAEGERLSKRLVDTLTRKGYEVINDPSSADIIFAHSLGCYMIPSDCRAKVILLVGIPCVPTRTLPVALARKLAREVRHHRAHGEFGWWCKKAAYGVWCAVSKPHNLYYLFAKRRPEQLPSAEGRTVVAIRPHEDPFMPQGADEMLKAKGYKYIELHGMHDDCWLDADSYADTIEVTAQR